MVELVKSNIKDGNVHLSGLELYGISVEGQFKLTQEEQEKFKLKEDHLSFIRAIRVSDELKKINPAFESYQSGKLVVDKSNNDLLSSENKILKKLMQEFVENKNIVGKMVEEKTVEKPKDARVEKIKAVLKPETEKVVKSVEQEVPQEEKKSLEKKAFLTSNELSAVLEELDVEKSPQIPKADHQTSLFILQGCKRCGAVRMIKQGEMDPRAWICDVCNGEMIFIKGVDY